MNRKGPNEVKLRSSRLSGSRKRRRRRPNPGNSHWVDDDSEDCSYNKPVSYEDEMKKYSTTTRPTSRASLSVNPVKVNSSVSNHSQRQSSLTFNENFVNFVNSDNIVTVKSGIKTSRDFSEPENSESDTSEPPTKRNYSCSTKTHSNSKDNCNIPVVRFLREWAIKFNIPLHSLDALLKILRTYSSFSNLPCSTKALLQTPKNLTKHSVESDAEAKTVTMDSLAHSLRSLSSEFIKVTSNLVYLKKGQEKLMKTLENSISVDVENEGYPQSNVIQGFPIQTMNGFVDVEAKLEEEDIMRSCITHFYLSAHKASLIRSVTSIMSKVMSLEVASHFTWNGVRRKDQKQIKNGLKECNVAKLIMAATKKCWPAGDLYTIELTAGRWLTQAPMKLARLNPKLAVVAAGED